LKQPRKGAAGCSAGFSPVGAGSAGRAGPPGTLQRGFYSSAFVWLLRRLLFSGTFFLAL